MRFPRNRSGWSIGLATLALLLFSGQPAFSDTVDLTGGAGSSGTINGALFQWTGGGVTGTGVFPAFVQLTGNSLTKEGYNTTENNIFDNGAADPHNHAILLSDIPIVMLGNIAYREFILDINQNNNSAESLISLDEIQIFQNNLFNPDIETKTGALVDLPGLIYQLDSGVDSWIKLDYALNHGSGSGDMLMYVPNSLFSTGGQYVYLYSAFGGTGGFTNNDGFEEWALRPGSSTPPSEVVPEPSSVLLLASGLIGVVIAARRKMAK